MWKCTFRSSRPDWCRTESLDHDHCASRANRVAKGSGPAFVPARQLAQNPAANASANLGKGGEQVSPWPRDAEYPGPDGPLADRDVRQHAVIQVRCA